MDALFAYFLLRERKYVPPRHERVQYNIRDLCQNDKSGYFVVDELIKFIPQVKYEKLSFCAGLLSIKG